MKPKNLYKLGDFSGWILLVILIFYFISGYAMVHKYGMEYIMSSSHAWVWHKYLTIPFFIFLFLHIVPYYIARKQIKKFLIVLTLVSVFSIAGVLAIDKLLVPEVSPQVKSEQSESKSIKCKNCPQNCIIKPNQTGRCGKFKNIDGKLKPVEETK